jgi:cytochrome P450
VSVPEIDLTDPSVITDPAGAYGRARERSAIARLLVPGMPMWAVLRHAEARAMLSDPRFELSKITYQRPEVPAECLPHLRSLQEMDGAEHARLRRLVSPAFTPRRAAQFRPRIQVIVDRLLDALDAGGPVELVTGLARPLPMEVICELVGIPEVDRPRWHSYGEVFASGRGDRLGEVIPAFVADARTAVEQRRAVPAAERPDDLLSELVRVQDEDGDRLTDVEVVGLVWQVVLGGQTPTNLLANGIAALLTHPDQLAALRADRTLLPGAVEELLRWCGPQLLTFPRYAREDAELAGVTIKEGEPVVASVVATNRDPRVFTDADRLDITRRPGTASHLGFAHGPHFCLGAALARVQTEVALDTLLRRAPDLALAVPATEVSYLPDPGTWRLAALPVTL